ncbi:MAG: plasmid recombination protein [Clostridiales bacterium]|nr:plasmid recombination protein [Clostridiales bacterium]
MMGKGSLTHNSREFIAENVDPSRTHLNTEYCNEKIKDVYHELFDEAVARYNAKQKRKDRCIDDYYEKIRSGKQEKLFHEIVIQIGNKDDMGAMTENGALAATVLDEYMKDFQARNPTLRVFSAHLHMDEATPHLHIDFVPYITGSSRGVDTRVSLKQALMALGFKGGTRSETEWNQWANAEKEQLAKAMAQHDIEWEHLGTHEEHLSVLEYKKQERAKEVAALEEQRTELEQTNADYTAMKESFIEQLSEIDAEIHETQERKEKAEKETDAAEVKAEKVQKKLTTLTGNMNQVERYAAEYTHFPEEWLPQAETFESGKAYRKRILPIITAVVKLLQPLYAKYLDMKRKYDQLQSRNQDLNGRVDNLAKDLKLSQQESNSLRKDLNRVKTVLGDAAVEDAIQTAKRHEQMMEAQKSRNRKYGRDAR